MTPEEDRAIVERMVERLRGDGPVTSVHFDQRIPTLFFDRCNIVIWADFVVRKGEVEARYPSPAAVYLLFDLAGEHFVSVTEGAGLVSLEIGPVTIEAVQHSGPGGDTLLMVGGRDLIQALF